MYGNYNHDYYKWIVPLILVIILLAVPLAIPFAVVPVTFVFVPSPTLALMTSLVE